jgi:hypothetical protein
MASCFFQGLDKGLVKVLIHLFVSAWSKVSSTMVLTPKK